MARLAGPWSMNTIGHAARDGTMLHMYRSLRAAAALPPPAAIVQLSESEASLQGWETQEISWIIWCGHAAGPVWGQGCYGELRVR